MNEFRNAQYIDNTGNLINCEANINDKGWLPMTIKRDEETTGGLFNELLDSSEIIANYVEPVPVVISEADKNKFSLARMRNKFSDLVLDVVKQYKFTSIESMRTWAALADTESSLVPLAKQLRTWEIGLVNKMLAVELSAINGDIPYPETEVEEDIIIENNWEVFTHA